MSSARVMGAPLCRCGEAYDVLIGGSTPAFINAWATPSPVIAIRSEDTRISRGCKAPW
jgi:hypothetical protein